MTLRPLTTLLRHLLAGVVTVMSCLLLWTIAYLALLAWALVTNEGLGGPLAYPIGLLAILILSTGASLILFFPATTLSEFLCRRKALHPVLAGIPLTCSFVAAEVLVLVCIQVAMSPPPDELSVFAASAAVVAFLLVPLGIYWWTSQFPSLTTRLYHKLRRRKPVTDDQASKRSAFLNP